MGGLGGGAFGATGMTAPSLFGGMAPAAAQPGMTPGIAGQPTVVMAQPGMAPYTQLPPAPSTNPYPYGRHALFTPVSSTDPAAATTASATTATAAAIPNTASSLSRGSIVLLERRPVATTGPTTSHPLPLDETLATTSAMADKALVALTPARAAGARMSAASTPLVGFRSPRALDIDADALTAAVTEPPPGDRASSAMGMGNGAASAANNSAFSAGQTPATGVAPTPQTSREGYAAPQPRRGPLPQLTVDELLHTSPTAEDAAAADDEEGGGGGGDGGGDAIDVDEGGMSGAGADESAAQPARATLPASTGDDASMLEVRPYGREALRYMSEQELAAIDNFEVSAPGKGRLRWPGRTDVRGALDKLGEIVKFRVQGVSVYEGGDKPAPGEGLNKQCVYTMENVWARDRATGEFLTDARSIGAFRTQLLRKADRMGARHVSYDHQRGEWTIEVANW